MINVTEKIIENTLAHFKEEVRECECLLIQCVGGDMYRQICSFNEVAKVPVVAMQFCAPGLVYRFVRRDSFLEQERGACSEE